VRMQLVPPGSGKASPPQQQQGQQPQATQQAANGGGGSGGGTGQQQGQSKATGQKSVKDAGKDSKYHITLTQDAAQIASKMVKSLLDDKKTYHHVTDKKDYCGGEAGKDQFSKVLTLAGPAINVYGRIG
jgi:hypothetical protein